MTSGPQQSATPLPDPAMWTAPPPGPVSFSAAAASVAPPKRRPWRAAVVAVPALVLVAAASSIVTAVAVGGHSTSGTGTQASGSGASAGKVRATVGTIASTHGSSWTLTTASGKSVSVELGAKTAYGSKTDPSAASAFHAGSHVKIMGADQGSTITATRVVLAPGKSAGAAGNTTTS